ncbi:hypothetical protein [Pseudochryseolinea flava]|uniref:Uncharacterized protein n=1 Tax=Pseudochryseolinea flava TaxID=2059302 RepID=A0A364XTZ8_9BACT|nr:hypothetical protein [Pseudochryseolinea flava]RAV97615.1 hypothetical protein DQQ10_27515 [Pseudochryseolinea flava]
MFGIFKAKNNDKDVTTNPDILFSPDIKTSEIKIHGLKLQDNANLIPKNQVSTTTFEKYPVDCLRFSNGGTRQTWKDNKVFYETVDGQKEHLLEDRIKSVLDFGGILHMKSGAKYVVRDRMIVGMGIHSDILRPYKKIAKGKIEKKFGKATRIEEDYEQTDGELWHTTYFYENRDMKISFFDPDNEIDFINVGLFPYSFDNRP